MLITSSFQISPHVTQASLGDSMRWCVEGERGIALIDGCSAGEVELFAKRLERLGKVIHGKQLFRLYTADDLDRLFFPDSFQGNSTAIIGGPRRKHSPPGTFELAADSAALDLGGVTVRRIPLGLAQAASAAYMVEPDGVLLVDTSLGFFRGRELPAPGAVAQLESSVAKLEELAKLDVAAIGLPWAGALTGALGPKHLLAVAELTKDLFEDFRAQLLSHHAGDVSTLSSKVKLDLENRLYSVPSELIEHPSSGHLKALARACGGVCAALSTSVPTT